MAQQENKMGTMHIDRLLITMAIPMMISMLVQALYNIVDSIFVSYYSEKALTAVSLCFPIQTLMIAFAGGTTVGVNSILSRRLGEKRFDEANQTAMNGLFLGVATAIFFALFGILFSRRLFSFFTDDLETIQFGGEYLFIVTLFSLGLFIQFVGEKLLQSTGKTHLSMFAQLAGALTNIILDPILIFGYLGFPQLGIAGAALATVIGQWFAMLIALWLNHRKNKEIKLHFRGFRPDFKIIRDIYKIGIPSIIMQSIISIMTFSMNKILSNDTAIAVFGVYYKLQSFVFMPVFGLTNALIPIVAYNYGAQNKSRILKTLRLSMMISVGIMALGTCLFEFFPAFFLKLFNAKDELLQLGIPALRMICVGFCFSGVSIILCSCFQALGKAFLSMVVSILRQLVIILPAALVLKLLFGLDYVWLSLTAAEVVGAAVCIFMYTRVYRNIIKPLA